MRDEPVAICGQGDGTERRAVSLRTTPGPVIPREVDIILWLAQAGSRGKKGSRGVCHGLEDGLGADEVLDDGLELFLAEEELVDYDLHCQSRIAGPCIEVYPVIPSQYTLYRAQKIRGTRTHNWDLRSKDWLR